MIAGSPQLGLVPVAGARGEGRHERLHRHVPARWNGHFSVRQDNGSGYVTISPAAMVAPEVENAILAHLVHPAHHGTAQCPGNEPIVTGRVFYCTASWGSTHARVEVRILDGSGLRYHVRVV